MVYDATQTIDLENVPLHGEFLIKTLEPSDDPYVRAIMREAHIKSYTPAFTLRKPLAGYGVRVVLRSGNPEVKSVHHVYGMLAYIVCKDLTLLEIPWSSRNAWQNCVHGMERIFKYSKAKKGETMLIPTGAGPVGSLVIASAGSEDKVMFMKESGAAVAFNYKTTSTVDVLAKEGPIDIYWDNVGGDTPDAALDAARVHVRFIECGMISGYNSGGAPVNRLFQVIAKAIDMHGCNVFHLEPKWNAAFYATLPPVVAAGQIKRREQLFNGLEKFGDVMLAVQNGENTAKVIVHVAHE